MFAGTSSFDCRIQCQQIRLICNFFDLLCRLTDQGSAINKLPYRRFNTLNTNTRFFHRVFE